MKNNWKKYILWFAQEHVDFRHAEFQSLATLLSLQFRVLSENMAKPFWIVEFPNDETALKFASRSILLRCIFELWSHASTLPAFHQETRKYIDAQSTEVDYYFNSERSFKINVETYNKHFSQTEKVQKIETLDYLPIAGSVDLRQPQVEWWYIEFWGLDPTAVPDVPVDILFGRLLGKGQRQLIKELSLKQRKFIGNTSMDAQLSLLMANQACVRNGDLVFDPFAGTGSLLVSAAKFGGYVLGADIDFMMLHARSRPSRITQKTRANDESIRANLQQYGCGDRYMDILVADFSNPYWREDLQFDCIITDPPYGIREANEMIKTKTATSSRANTRTDDMPHYPSTSHYALDQLYADLLAFAAKHLKTGGRLVCWLPFHRADYSEDILPQHQCLTLVANSEQLLTGSTVRRLLTYEKLDKENSEVVQSTKIALQTSEFRDRYFDSGLESRNERRQRKAEQREKGRLEAIKRGKVLRDGRELKCVLNKERFS